MSFYLGSWTRCKKTAWGEKVILQVLFVMIFMFSVNSTTRNTFSINCVHQDEH